MKDFLNKHIKMIVFSIVWIIISLVVFGAIISVKAEPQPFETYFYQIIPVDDIEYNFTTKCSFSTYEGEFCAGEKFYLTNLEASVKPIMGGEKYNYTQQIYVPDYFGDGLIFAYVEIDFTENSSVSFAYGQSDFLINQEGNDYYLKSDIIFNTEETTVPLPSTNYSLECNPLKVKPHSVYEDFQQKQNSQGITVLLFLLSIIPAILIGKYIKNK